MERGRWRRGWHHRRELDRTPSIPYPHILFRSESSGTLDQRGIGFTFFPLYTTTQDYDKRYITTYMAARESFTSFPPILSYLICTIPGRNRLSAGSHLGHTPYWMDFSRF